jgi:hypothetical protein
MQQLTTSILVRTACTKHNPLVVLREASIYKQGPPFSPHCKERCTIVQALQHIRLGHTTLFSYMLGVFSRQNTLSATDKHSEYSIAVSAGLNKST